ncbi:TylF/MycF/NovP-related O-methyltransferase [Bradyrhizobium elkanii]|uniref:TylF/MycF/NovP-related O-methyltransferase n=1 Tax=Bradyrhizobium elkanii TaxID=29448 RepID=UPI0004AD4F41|nr:TylF/MycF/NovP-related O-methyltransferase [Bradyrhizobium elkanii]WLA85824.1 TylF/MycF/NovP-related O-methyltransferase [Bradyrhizobium elkanii]
MKKDARFWRLSQARQISGFGHVVDLPDEMPDGDSIGSPNASTARLFENGREIGPAHALHSDIEALGQGRFSHWGRQLYLSASDGTSASSNGRVYELLIEPEEEGVAGVLRDGADRVSALQSDYERFELAERLFNILVPGAKVSEFGRTYFEDQSFASVYERFGEGNYRAYDRRWTVAQLARHAVSLEGTFAECGVYRGATAYLIARTLKLYGASGLKLHLFDSFSGLSNPSSSMDGQYWRAGDMAAGLDEVRANLAEWSDCIIIHPGWIPSRFSDVATERFAFVHIDVDLFQPTHDSLVFFYERMLPGGVILCDDYGFASCPGARTAMEDFFESVRETIIHLPTGQGLVIVNGR